MQRGYITKEGIKGERFGGYEKLELGATSLSDLAKAGIRCLLPTKIPFTFREFKRTGNVPQKKPDRVYLVRKDGDLRAVAVAEFKPDIDAMSEKQTLSGAEQALISAYALDAKIAILSDGKKDIYVDAEKSVETGRIVYLQENRSLNPAVLDDLLAGQSTVRDPSELAEKVWQIIWHATKDEPKECLLTFVELFLLKFLSDNLPPASLASSHSFYELTSDGREFAERHGKTQIEYYIENIRPEIKKIFHDNTICDDEGIPKLFGLSTVVSKTSVINGFSFLRSSDASHATYNKAFLDILGEFGRFGSLTSIDPEFKTRLYEAFLKKSFSKAKLGQFFTPRNVVRAVVEMARLDRLEDGAVCLDPAAGVGGFVLEPYTMLRELKDDIVFAGGTAHRKKHFVGVDVDAKTHILAKANMLIHFAENVRSPSVTTAALNKLMAKTFVLMNGNETLGSLEHPPTCSVDVIMTNPPYVTKGSKIYRESISSATGTRNGLVLQRYYEKVGLGLEGLFLRYISGALKPGGRAFVIVPLGMLARTEKGLKRKLLKECSLLAVISLPQNTFFNTPQKTYILAFQKRHTEHEARPPVFCAIAKSIGESLDSRRIPRPDDNALREIAKTFAEFADGNGCAESPHTKLVGADRFDENSRWDIRRFWTREELVAIGEKEAPIDRLDYIDETLLQIGELAKSLAKTRKELSGLGKFKGVRLRIDNPEYFRVRPGKRIRKKDCDANPGEIPVYSCSRERERPLGFISERWLGEKNIPVEEGPTLTINANGSVGCVFVRNERCAIHDDVIVIDILHKDIEPEYVKCQLENSIAKGCFEYEAKLFKTSVSEIRVDIPATPEGGFDTVQQKSIARAYRNLDDIKQKLAELGEWSEKTILKSKDVFE